MKFLNYTNKTAIGRSSPLVLFGVLAGLVFPLAMADEVPPADQGDLILGFRRPQNQSGTYLVNIGPVSQLIASSPGAAVPVPGVGSLGADLATFTTFEDDTEVPWHSTINIKWGGISRNSGDNEVVYITKKRPSHTVQSIPWEPLNRTRHNTAYTRIGSVIQQGYSTLAATTSNTKGGFQDTPTEGISYYLQVNKPGTIDFGTWSNIEGDFAAGVTGSALDLYEHRPLPGIGAGAVTYIGYFTITETGVLSFTRAGTDPGDTDSDGDGFTDTEEELAGTDPNDPASFFTLPPPVKTAGGATHIQLGSVAINRRYVVEYSENLQDWDEVHVHLSGAGPSPLDFVDDDPERSENPHGFYRVTVGLP